MVRRLSPFAVSAGVFLLLLLNPILLSPSHFHVDPTGGVWHTGVGS